LSLLLACSPGRAQTADQQATCPMHMNPPLSYIDPANEAHLGVLPGVTLRF
jgi:hypothetical protein